MKKILLMAALPLIFAGCCSNDIRKAKNMIRRGHAECVIVQNGRIAAVAKGRGLSPLLNLYDEKNPQMKGSAVIDKVIGRAAAFIVIKGEASEAFGKIMSEDAKTLLEQHNIKVSYDLLVPYILNNQRNGLCPLEDSVKNINAPDDALKAMRQRITELKSKQK